MIAITSNSLNSNSTLPPIPNAVECPFLERVTGADMMISIAPYPVRTEALLLKHIESGAILVQHKDTMDVITSLGDRLDESIARMCTIAFRQYQRVLLTVGIFAEHNGGLVCNGHDTGVKWVQYQGAMSKWGKRGGVIENLDKRSLIPQWCEMQVKHLNEMSGAGTVKQVYQRSRMPHDAPKQNENGEFDDPLQLLIPVQDARNLLLSLPDCGPATVEWLWKMSGHNAWLALQIATHSEWYKHLPDKPRSFGPAFIRKAQAYLGAHEHADKLIAFQQLVKANGEKSDDSQDEAH